MQSVDVEPLDRFTSSDNPFRRSNFLTTTLLTTPSPSISAARLDAEKSDCTLSFPASPATYPSAEAPPGPAGYHLVRTFLHSCWYDSRGELPHCDSGIRHQLCGLSHPRCVGILFVPPASSAIVGIPVFRLVSVLGTGFVRVVFLVAIGVVGSVFLLS